MKSHVQGLGSMTDRLRAYSLAGWMSRSFGAIRADLEPVDSASLDVLLYCTDEVVARESREGDGD